MFGNVATVDNWSGGTLHPVAAQDLEQDWTKSQHFIQGVTFGATNPIPGNLSPGAYLSTETASSTVCTDANKRLSTSGCVNVLPVQTFSSKNLAGNVSLVANTLTTLDSITVNAAGGAAPAFQSSTGTWRAQVCYTYIAQQGTGSNAGESYVTDGTNNWALSLAIISGGSSASYISCGWSTVIYTGASAVTFTVKAENPGAQTILATSALTAQPSRMQVAIFGSN
jgi:hypothetical protein